MKKKKFFEIIRFLIGGGAGVLVYYIAIYTLTELAGLWYIYSATIAFFLNGGTSFVVQKFWTFKNKKKAVTKQFILYFSMGGCFFFINIGLLYALVDGLGLYYLLAQLILTIILTTASFFITKRIFAN